MPPKAAQVTPDSKVAWSIASSMAALSIRSPTDKGLFTQSKPVTVIVGRDGASQTFYIHEHLAKRFSAFFAAALNKPWKESETHTVHLPYDTPEYFDMFARFIYDGKIHCTRPDDKISGSGDREWPRLGEAWALGDKLMSDPFKDAVMDALKQKLESVYPSRYPLELPSIAYVKTSGENSFKRLAIDVALWQWGAGDLQSDIQDSSPKEFFQDLCEGLLVTGKPLRKGAAPYCLNNCEYHEHVRAGTLCYKKMFT